MPNYDPARTPAASGDELGALTLEGPAEIAAGEYGSWKFTYTAGQRQILHGGGITLFTECDSDWQRPQANDSTDDGFVSVQGPPSTVLIASFPDDSTIRITVAAGQLSRGDSITVTLGDQRFGGAGTRTQTFYENRRYFLCEVETRDGSKGVLETQPFISIAGGDLGRLEVIAPPDANTSDHFSLWVKASDPWGNPAQRFKGVVTLSAPGIMLPIETVKFDEEETGCVEVPGCRVTEPGILRVEAASKLEGISCLSNPITATTAPVGERLFWGDPHSGQVADARKIGEYFRHARDVAKLQFAGFQRNDSAHSTAAYRVQLEEEKNFHEPGRFVPLPGFEWSAHLDWGGHHNVYFRRFDQPMKRWDGAKHLGEAGESDLPHVRDLHNHYRGTDTVITPHVGGQHADLQWHDPELEPVLEVVSTHGSFEWFLRESIQRGYRMGFVGGNDCHTGRPGDDRPGHQLRRYAKGGLTGVYAEELSLSSVLDALRMRRCYATTGARIRAASRIGDCFMGEDLTTAELPEIEISAAGTGPLERIDVFRGVELLHTEEVFPGRSANVVRLTWTGASRMSSYSGIVWNCQVRLKGSKIASVEGVRFDSPRSRWSMLDEQTVEIHSWTCGYTSGLEIELADPESAELTVVFDSALIIGEKFGLHGEVGPRRMAQTQADSGAVTLKFSDLGDEPVSLDMGHLDRRLTVERRPEPGAFDASVSVNDPSPAPGFNPYWARVTQLDQEVAWLSPIFVDFIGS